MHSLGIDLAGLPKNPSGIAWVDILEGRAFAKKAHSDDEILFEVRRISPAIISIDAPFAFPTAGRSWRPAEYELLKEGFKPLSPMLQSMRPLVERAKVLVARLRGGGYKVIEAFPRAAEKILGTEKNALGKQIGRLRISQDEYDAVLCALVGLLHVRGRTRSLGPGDDAIVLPLKEEVKLK